MVLVSSTDGAHCTARIVETEAYVGPDDAASHAAERIGRTRRNAAMFGPPGRAYVYRIYGLHWCLNVVTDEPGHPAAVLVRAAEPVDGLEAMRARRAGRPDQTLLRGPGNLCRALGVDASLDHHPLTEPPLRIVPGVPVPDREAARGPRVGVTRAAERPLRFWIQGSSYVSARPGTSR